jgi:hypothetical protein
VEELARLLSRQLIRRRLYEALQREALPMVTLTAIVKQTACSLEGAQSILIDSRCKHEAPLIL